MDAAKENMVKKYNLVKAIEEEVTAAEEALKIVKDKARGALIEYENAKFQVDIIKRKNHIEEIFWRFPHVGQQIFEKLDNQSLAKCQIVSPLWKKSIEDYNIILKYSANYVFPANWAFSVLRKKKPYFSLYESDVYRICLKMCQDSEHFDGDRLFLIKAMTKNMENKNPVYFPLLFGNTFLHCAAKIGDLEACQYLIGKSIF